MPMTDEALYQLLLENEYLDEKKLIKAADLGKQENISLSDAILQLDLLSDENL